MIRNVRSYSGISREFDLQLIEASTCDQLTMASYVSSAELLLHPDCLSFVRVILLNRLALSRFSAIIIVHYVLHRAATN